MPLSSAAVSPSLTQASPAGGDEGQDEIEYESEYEEIEEEIEVEEEVEVEEGVEEQVVEGNEEDGDESQIGEDLTPAREENNLDDTDQDMELEQDEEHLNFDPLTMRISMENPQVDIATNQEFCGGFSSSERREGGQKEELCTKEKLTSRDTDAKASLDGKLEANDINNETFWNEGNATLTITDDCSQKDIGVGSAVAKPFQTSVKAVKVMKEMPSRMSSPPVTPRDSSYGAEFDIGNKRARIVCEFHAKGWCIRGKSCKFLHINEGLDAAGQKTSSSVHMLPPQSRDNPVNCQIEKSVVHKHDMLDGALEQAGNIPVGQNSFSDDFSRYTSPPVKCHSVDMNRALHGNFSGVLCDTYNKSRFFPSGTEKTISKKNDLVPDSHRLNLPYYSRPPVPFGSSSWTTNALGTWNTLENNQEYRASISSSFRKSPSPFSGSNSGSNNLTNTQTTKYKTKIFPDGWEPSVPFRPSHVITQNLFLKESPYDPILDGVVQTGAKDGPFEFSYFDPGVSVNNAHFQSNKLQKEKLLDVNRVGDTEKAIGLSSSCDNGLKLDEPRHQKELQMDGCGQKYENDIDIKRDENVLNESKALKYFHAALVEYVKEMVKPTWREGLMSKDAHKIIVKKAVEKVLSTVQPDQIPNTAESIKSYLSISQVKLSKLVEGYIEKYGKF
ncbi:protein FRIGIDA-ESSENTIAL 1-like isoform X2 [Primulina huaijiensis]|uniref:protein FRIGIDA-ESSENTIAL 1-like isoform X2 n=1 Tax=Primulina huaijiensis TaxID=1492673 RepID=UPI003CC77E29